MIIAQKAGLVLADVIRRRIQGQRPLTLAGFSLGARIIWEALVALSTSPNPAESLGIIENVVLFGLPADIGAPEKWIRARTLVAGRFIHCYSKNDWVLRFLYRTTSLTLGDIAGLNPIAHAHGIENVNMSHIVRGHLEYSKKTVEMLQLLHL